MKWDPWLSYRAVTISPGLHDYVTMFCVCFKEKKVPYTRKNSFVVSEYEIFVWGPLKEESTVHMYIV